MLEILRLQKATVILTINVIISPLEGNIVKEGEIRECIFSKNTNQHGCKIAIYRGKLNSNKISVIK